ncbi:hypothetical protein [Fluviibacter phosphoraccumulans]|uniref:hypothetical protein n=1 Tax=Fluviibacter phosphoraccumulans TaxID=1751046 RepID=UPI0010B8C49C|nr:hypothetical protein [Fluviibacter phosphoraccumulans]BCA65805.1 hypothetical protein SHINM1_014070 [Fluviibacter phosphoraccumulans]
MRKFFVTLILGLVGVGALPQSAIAGDDWKIISDDSAGSVRAIAFVKSDVELPLQFFGPIVFAYPGKTPTVITAQYNDDFKRSLDLVGYEAVVGGHPGVKIAKEFDLGGTSINSRVMYLGSYTDFKQIAAEMADRNGEIVNWAGVVQTVTSGVALAAGAVLSNQYLGVAGMTAANMQSQFGSFSKDDIDWFKASPDPLSGGREPSQVVVIKASISRYDWSGFWMKAWLDPVFLTVVVYKPMPEEKLLAVAAEQMAQFIRDITPKTNHELNEKQLSWIKSQK